MSYPRVRIGEILELKYGKSLPADIRSGAGYKVYGSNGITGLHEVAITSSPVIIVGRKGSIGEIHFSEKPCWPIDTTYYVESFGDSVDPRWLYHRLHNLNLKALNKAVAIPGLNRYDVYQLEIPLPPLEEQRRIAAILDKASAIRGCSEKAARNVAEIKASLFDEAFIAHDRHGHWDQLALGELCDVQGGLQVTSARSAMPIRVPYLRVANVLRGRLDLAEIKEINCSQLELDRTRLQPKDLLVVEGHGNPNEIGRVAMWAGQTGEIVHQNHLIRVRSKASSLDPEFLCFYLNSGMGRRHLLKRANTTSGLNTISTSVVRSAPIVVPPIDEQRSFCETIKNIAQLEARLLAGSALHAQLSRSLLSESFDK